MNKEREPTQQFSVRLPLSVLEKLDLLAEAGYRNRTQEIIRLIEEGWRSMDKNPKKPLDTQGR